MALLALTDNRCVNRCRGVLSLSAGRSVANAETSPSAFRPLPTQPPPTALRRRPTILPQDPGQGRFSAGQRPEGLSGLRLAATSAEDRWQGSSTLTEVAFHYDSAEEIATVTRYRTGSRIQENGRSLTEV